MPLNKAPEKGSIMTLPCSPVRAPITRLPISKRCDPSVKASCTTCPNVGEPAGRVVAAAGLPAWTPLGCCRRAQAASAIAIRMAGDSINTSATDMWPPKSMPCNARYWVAAMKVVALTEPYVAATAAALKLSSLRRRNMKPSAGTSTESRAAASSASMTSLPSPLLASEKPPFRPIDINRYSDKNRAMACGISRLERSRPATMPKMKNRMAGSSRFWKPFIGVVVMQARAS